jgi:hypothetical protein
VKDLNLRRRQEARQAGQLAIRTISCMAGDIGSVLLGRPSMALGMGQNVLGQAQGQAAGPMGPQLFDPNVGINLALQQRGQDIEFQGMQAQARGAMLGGIAGGLGTYAGLVYNIMAFQTGTKVDPRLMRADLSGFSRGTELAMAGIGAAIKGYATKKKENEQINFAAETLAGQAKDNPYVRGLFGISEEEAENITAAELKPAIKAFGGAKTAMGLSAQINLLTTKAAIEGGDPKDITSFTNAMEKLNC